MEPLLRTVCSGLCSEMINGLKTHNHRVLSDGLRSTAFVGKKRRRAHGDPKTGRGRTNTRRILKPLQKAPQGFISGFSVDWNALVEVFSHKFAMCRMNIRIFFKEGCAAFCHIKKAPQYAASPNAAVPFERGLIIKIVQEGKQKLAGRFLKRTGQTLRSLTYLNGGVFTNVAAAVI